VDADLTRRFEPWLRAVLAEDLGPGDVTSRLCVPEGADGAGRVTAKAPGVVAGIGIAEAVFDVVSDGAVRCEAAVTDGDRVGTGDPVLLVRGPARALLAGERTALNLLIRLSGVATLTARFVAAVAGTGARILDTRKTTPGLRALEKAAVVDGGGTNHRYALYDAVLVKENHLAFSGAGLAEALAARPAGLPAIVEAESMDEYRLAAEAGADVVMLDEFTPEQVAAVVAERGDAPRPELEVSGGITLDNVRAYAEAGADRISIGALTHSAPPLDLSLRIVPA